MLVLFLDFDGVITTSKSRDAMWLLHSRKHLTQREKNIEQIDKTLANNIRIFCERTGAKIVISSGWRLCDDMDDLKDFLLASGQIPSELIIDKTPFDDEGESRGKEISLWLQDHPEVTEFVILDDDHTVRDVKELIPRWVKTSRTRGFNEEKLGEALRLTSHAS